MPELAWTWADGIGASRALLLLSVPLLMLATGLGVVLGYHRLLTHKAARLHPLVERGLVLAALAAGTPVQWVGNHRYHHAHADTPLDPHSPHHRGFWIAHAGWYLGFDKATPASTILSVAYAFGGPLRTLFDAWWRPRTNQQHAGLAKDIAADPVYGWLSRPGPYAAVLLGYVAVLWGVWTALWGMPAVAALTFVHVIAYALGDAVNSLGHVWGRQEFRSRDRAKNSLLITLIAFGDGWHHSHHVFPGSIRAGVLPGQFDVAYRFVKILEALGLATALREPTAEDIARELLDAPPLVREAQP